VITGYAGDAVANVQNFLRGWLRTGDLGYLDPDGYLFLTGRLKEQINAGGEKVAPAEVEAALLAHPSVAQAAAFALPDPRLGETVGAAVVLQADAAPLDEPALRSFAAEQLAGFKVPRRIAVVPALPLEASGKVARAALAQRLGLAADEPAASMTDAA
jgi:acyl-CoA synthetase (AMP-forming)/AMP-acid ligase II